MKILLNAILMITIIVFGGCVKGINQPDFVPPARPVGLATETGDNIVELRWYANSERDVAGYNVFVSSTYNGRYQLIGTSRQPYFTDRDSRNGTTYYYAVTAYDFDGNESELSDDVAYDTPRPEGFDVLLKDYRLNPGLAGYDFSTYTVGQYNDQYTDIFFEYDSGSGAHYMDVWEDADIQDVGYTTSLYDIGEAPIDGWSPTKDVRLIVGHTYVVWTWDNHFAKVRITALSSSRVVFDWAYQLQSGNTRLKRTVQTERSPLQMGSGVSGRM